MKDNYKPVYQESIEIPKKGVMFLGGHPNLIKKLQQLYPKWAYVSDDQFQRKSSFNQDIIFYWTGHGSHQLMKYVYSKMSDNAKIIYVTATNLPLLLNEMNTAYQSVALK